MTLRLTEYGGTDWSNGEVLYAADLNDTLSETVVNLPPIGAILAWAKSITGVPALSPQWQECDGSQITDAESPMYLQNTPNLNTTQRFLRGASTSGTTGGADTVTLDSTTVPQHRHTITTGGAAESGSYVAASYQSQYSAYTGYYGGSGAHENKPAYYQVVWIIRIK